MIENEKIVQIVKGALAEDVGINGDVTTNLSIPEEARSTAELLVKSEGVIAGLNIARITFETFDPDIQFEHIIPDGTEVKKGDIPATIFGKTRSILTAERVALNFLQRMSGIATLTHQFVKAVEPYETIILDTRKTAPGLRLMDRIAVKAGGGQNHRYNLSDAILIKDNHIAAVGTIGATLEKVLTANSLNLPVEVEVKNIEELTEALKFPVNRILLDNMSLEKMREAVSITNGRVPLEASGNVNLQTVRSIAATGVTHISVGALTHSVKAMDVSLEI
ncbi:MAG: carboxylating nicotinate-nucleotide diphosphorylase [Candidatus Woesebacteria bacterium]|nr:MAG: carboxylating nicotinate-nucleotide diphosphorylase [Candidatus Woesebacteria bacterium]